MLRNYYPEFRVTSFIKTPTDMDVIIKKLQSYKINTEIKRSAYIIIRNESGNGMKVINYTNWAGVQADCGRWGKEFDPLISGVVMKQENLTGRRRFFLVFKDLDSFLEFLFAKIKEKGLFIGENVNTRYHKGDVRNAIQLADAYEDEWVYGEDHETTETEEDDFVSMYNQSLKLFPNDTKSNS